MDVTPGLADAAAFESAVMAAVGSGIGVVDGEGQLVHVNDALCRMLRTPRDRLLGALPPYDHWPPEHVAEVTAAFALGLEGRFPPEGLRLTLCRADGERFPVLVFVAPLPDGGGMVANLVDLSVQHRQAQALERQQERLAVVEDAAELGIWELDLRSGAVFRSPQCERLNGLAPGESIDHEAWLARVHPDDRDGLDHAAAQGLVPGHLFRAEFRLRMPDGHYRWLLSQGSARAGADGRVERLVGINVDITDRKRVEQELAQHRHHLAELVQARTAELTLAKEAAELSDRAKTVFIGNVSHELRTPLTSILGFTELALRRATDPRLRECLDTSLRAAHTLRALVDDLLDVSRIEAGRLAIEPAALKLGDLVEATRSLLADEAARRGLELVVQVDPVLQQRALWADPLRLQQVLTHYAANALKFTPAGRVTLAARATPLDAQHLRVTLEVTDTGIGVDPQGQAALFQAFGQVDTRATRAHGGAGLGLFICRRLAEAMGGTVGVDSRPGEGSRFWFTVDLPFAPA